MLMLFILFTKLTTKSLNATLDEQVDNLSEAAAAAVAQFATVIASTCAGVAQELICEGSEGIRKLLSRYGNGGKWLSS